MTRRTHAILLLLMTLSGAAALSAQDFDFTPAPTFGKPADVEPVGLAFTWDKPAVKAVKMEIFLLEQLWPQSIDFKIPGWRMRLIDESFDPVQWHEDGGPRMARYYIDVEEGRPAAGFIDRRNKYVYNYFVVLLIDQDGERHNVTNQRCRMIEPLETRSDLYYLETYQPWVQLDRVWDHGVGMSIEWTIPDLGGGKYKFKRLIFVGMTKYYGFVRMDNLENGIDDFLQGKDDRCIPLVAELEPDVTSIWLDSPINFYYPWVLAETEEGLRFVCPLKTSRDVTSADKKNLPKLVLGKAGADMGYAIDPKSEEKGEGKND